MRSFLIERVREATPEIVEALNRLIPQLTTNNPPPRAADVRALVDTDANVLLIARQTDAPSRILGSGCVCAYRVPTGVRAVVEDVVVDVTARGQGIGEALLHALIAAAGEMGAKGVSLTSNPARGAANKLYLRMGFKLRNTNSYYYQIVP
jgi:ribosomal protein S18 acetylase RimI-like enzyme